MKTLVLALVFTFPLIISGQDWAPVNPERSPQFTLDGEENIDFSIKIDSTSSSGENAWYYLHPAYLLCDTCPTPVPECTPPNAPLYLKQTPLLGDSILKSGNTYSLFGSDVVLKPNTNLGQSYNFTINVGNELIATVTEYTEMEVFGILDSIKTFSISDSREIVLSKNHGIISFTTESGSTQTVSGIPELQLGDYFPGIREFYNFAVGDVFVFAGSSYASQGYNSWLLRFDITDVLLFSDSVKITFSTTSKSTIWNTYPEPVSTSTSFTENNIQTISFNNHSLQGLIPKMISYDIDSIQMFSADTYTETATPYYNSYKTIETNQNDRRGLSIGGYSAHFEPYYLTYDYVGLVYLPTESVKARRILCEPEDGTTNYLLNDSLTIHYGNIGSCEVFVEYVEGLGTTCFYNDCGLASNLTFMIGYKKDGEEYGNVFSPGEILDTREILTEAEVKIFPNPAKSNITISIPEQYSGTFDISLTDMTGRQVLKQTDFINNSIIDIHKLPAGTYILFGTNEQIAFTRKVVVE